MSQKERSLAKKTSAKDSQLAELNEEFSKFNVEGTQPKSTISDLQKVLSS